MEGDRTARVVAAGLALAGSLGIPRLESAAASVDVDDVKGLVELLGHRLGLGAVWRPSRSTGILHPGR